MKRIWKHELKTYFYTLFTRIISVVLFSLLVMSVSFYISFRGLTLDYVYKSHLNSLNQVSENVYQMTGYVKTFGASLFTNKFVQILMYDKDPSIVSQLECIRNIENLLASTPFLQSVEITNRITRNAYYIGTKYQCIATRETFFDKDFALYADNGGIRLVTPVARQIPVSVYSEEKADVLSYILSETAGTDRNLVNVLAVNMNTSWIFNGGDKRNPGYVTGEIYLADEEGLVLASTDKKDFLSRLSQKSFGARLNDETADYGFFTDGEGEEKVLVVYTKMHSPGFFLVNTIPYDYIALSVIKLRSMTLIISGFILLLGFFISVSFSKKLYSPVSRLLGKTASLLKGTRSQKNEFDYIDASIVSAAEQIESLRRLEKRSLNQERQDFLKSLFFEACPLEAARSLFQKYGIELNPSASFLLVQMRMDHYRKFIEENSAEDRATLKFGFSNLVREKLAESFGCETAELGGDVMGVLVEVPAEVSKYSPSSSEKHWEAAEVPLRDVLFLLGGAVALINKYFGISFSILANEMPGTIDLIPKRYAILAENAGYRLIYGHGSTKTIKEMRLRGAVHQDILDLNVGAVLDALKACNAEKARSAYRELEENLLRALIPDISVALSYIASMVFNTIALLEKNSGIPLEANFQAFSERLGEIETLEEAREAFDKLFDSITEKVAQYRSTRNPMLFEAVSGYIEKNYQSSTITSNEIAETFNMTPAYLNRIFKEQKTLSIQEYITHLKVHKACGLLSDTDMAVEEIIRKIGWDNKNYFFTVFKKNTGVTPTEYRLMHQK